MPGISFLFKKRFHPSRLDNQKKLFIAEQTLLDRKKIEEERSLEVVKDLDGNYGRDALSDPRSTSLKFMYSVPLATIHEKDHERSKQGKFFEPKVGVDGDDEMVRAFRHKLQKKSESSLEKGNNKSLPSNYDKSERNTVENYQDIYENRVNKKSKTTHRKNDHLTKLELEAGKRSRTAGLTQDEQGERFSFLKNAPLEGLYAKNVVLKHKPFNEIVRNVQCIRCGEWGHQSGDRECVLRDYNPHDLARQKREDPLTYMQSTDFLLEKQKLILRHAASAGNDPNQLGNNIVAKQNIMKSHSSVDHIDEQDVDSSDPESEFIAALSSKERKSLLKKLQENPSDGDNPILIDKVKSFCSG